MEIPPKISLTRQQAKGKRKQGRGFELVSSIHRGWRAARGALLTIPNSPFPKAIASSTSRAARV